MGGAALVEAGRDHRRPQPGRLQRPLKAPVAARDLDGHVHVDDTNRLQPGAGHMDFRSVFDALAAVGYDDWLTFECRLRGEPEEACPPRPGSWPGSSRPGLRALRRPGPPGPRGCSGGRAR
ncbi:MAG TPA: TIM barrel protein [Actinomycetota bacterium]|nr:TIM barrel protein [Actinomycetota bacterium]